MKTIPSVYFTHRHTLYHNKRSAVVPMSPLLPMGGWFYPLARKLPHAKTRKHQGALGSRRPGHFGLARGNHRISQSSKDDDDQQVVPVQNTNTIVYKNFHRNCKSNNFSSIHKKCEVLWMTPRLVVQRRATAAAAFLLPPFAAKAADALVFAQLDRGMEFVAN